MKVLSLALALLTIALPAAARAAGAPPADEPHGLVVSSHYWGRTEKTFVHPVFGTMTEETWERVRRDPRLRRRLRMSPPPNILIQRETYALVRNAGTRTVKVITWDYVFYEDVKHEKELRRFEFRTKETLKPGEMKFLTESVDEPQLSSFGEIVIERVEYSDGSVWQRT